MAACSVRAQPALKEGRSKACRDSRTSKGQAWQKEAEFSVSPGCFDDIYYMLLPPTVDGPAKSCTTWKMLKTVVSLYSLSHYWVEKPSFLVQHFTTIHRLLTGFPSYPPRPLDRETDQRKQLFVSSKKRQWTWKSDWENDYICTTIKLKNKQWKKNGLGFGISYIYIYTNDMRICTRNMVNFINTQYVGCIRKWQVVITYDHSLNHDFLLFFHAKGHHFIFGWWLTYPSDKYESVGKDDIPYIKWNITFPIYLVGGFKHPIYLVGYVWNPCLKPPTSYP